jgi:hypothetical protein
MFGQLTSYMINFGFRSPKELTSPKDFMPSEWIKTKPARKKRTRTRMTKKRRERIAAKIAAIFGVTY